MGRDVVAHSFDKMVLHYLVLQCRFQRPIVGGAMLLIIAPQLDCVIPGAYIK